MDHRTGNLITNTTSQRNRKSLAHLPSSQNEDQENMTADIGVLTKEKRVVKKEWPPLKKSRSKSIGPGGLSTLETLSGNSRKPQSAVKSSYPLPRPILKLNMPSTPEISGYVSPRQASPRKVNSPIARMTDDLIDLSLDTYHKTDFDIDSHSSHSNSKLNASENETRVNLRNEDGQQQAYTRNLNEKEKQNSENDSVSRREARRKSLANRRVSFAPEATLHTWDVVVEYQDSTTSTSSTNSARKAQSVSHSSNGSPDLRLADDKDTSISPKPLEQSETGMNIPDNHNSHPKKRRRTSAISPPKSSNTYDELFSSSPPGLASLDDSNIGNVNGGSKLENDSGDCETLITIDGGKTSNLSLISTRSSESNDTSTQLNEALRQAAYFAGTQGIEFDKNYGIKKTDDKLVASFTPWSKKDSANSVNTYQEIESKDLLTQTPIEESKFKQNENTFDLRLKDENSPSKNLTENDEISMDVTRALGRIIDNDISKTKSKSELRHNQFQAKPKNILNDDISEDETMELTVALGDIRRNNRQCVKDLDDHYDLNSGISLSPINLASYTQKLCMENRESLDSPGGGDGTMDMTMAMGGIIKTAYEDIDSPMEITTALGRILPPVQLVPNADSQPNQALEPKVDRICNQSDKSLPFDSQPTILGTAQTVTSETGSPTLIGIRGKTVRRNSEVSVSRPKKRQSKSTNSPKKLGASPKPVDQLRVHMSSPSRVSPSKKNIERKASPNRLTRSETKKSTPQILSKKGLTTSNNGLETPSKKDLATPLKKSLKTPKLKSLNDEITGFSVPNLTLTPQPRPSSGIGFDKVGLGSPRVAKLLDRRGSIGSQSRSFVPGEFTDISLGARLIDPRVVEQELEKEEEEQEPQKNRENTLHQESNQTLTEKDATLNLKEMIYSLTPKKKPLKGRKSLHVGAAKGLLGKRPIELDEDDDYDDGDNEGIKRLKNHQGSPVKSVKLHAPPSKTETTSGRLVQSSQKSLGRSDLIYTTPAMNSMEISETSPQSYRTLNRIESQASSSRIIAPVEKIEHVEKTQNNPNSCEDKKIQLQDFLNMTSIRFMELTTTKRRNTMACKSKVKDSSQERKKISWEDCVAAGAATIPMLELFQHACHELKRYISEGRKTVREIETETWEENPPLFREYMSATSDMKVIMDNQLKNVKTHSRLLSKEMWYDWRTTLLSTLKEGLIKSAEGMINDKTNLEKQQSLLNSVLPSLTKKFKDFSLEENELRVAAQVIAECNKEDLSEARQTLIAVDGQLQTKKLILEELRNRLQDTEKDIEKRLDSKRKIQEEIIELENIREECRGWTSYEINQIQSRVEAIEKTHGWSIKNISRTRISMTYRKEVKLDFDIPSSKNSSGLEMPLNSKIDILYIGSNRKLTSNTSSTVEIEFFIKCIQKPLLEPATFKPATNVKSLLNFISTSWGKARKLIYDIRLLTLSCPTEAIKLSDDSISVESTLLIRPVATKIAITFHLTSVKSNDEEIEFKITTKAQVIYGERYNEIKMSEFLLNRCAGTVVKRNNPITSSLSWGDALNELEERLIARGRK